MVALSFFVEIQLLQLCMARTVWLGLLRSVALSLLPVWGPMKNGEKLN